MKRRPTGQKKIRQQKKRRTPQARGWYRSSKPQRNSRLGILGNPADKGALNKRKRRVSIKRVGTFLGLCALGVGVATLAKTPPQSFEEQVVSVHRRILTMPGNELAAYDDLLTGLIEDGYARFSPEEQIETMGALMDLTHPEARYGAGLAVYNSLDSKNQYMLLEDTAESLALAERTELTDSMLSTLPEYARRELLMRHGSELIDGLYHNAFDSAREGISDFLDNLLQRDKEDAQQQEGKQ